LGDNGLGQRHDSLNIGGEEEALGVENGVVVSTTKVRGLREEAAHLTGCHLRQSIHVLVGAQHAHQRPIFNLSVTLNGLWNEMGCLIDTGCAISVAELVGLTNRDSKMIEGLDFKRSGLPLLFTRRHEHTTCRFGRAEAGHWKPGKKRLLFLLHAVPLLASDVLSERDGRDRSKRRSREHDELEEDPW